MFVFDIEGLIIKKDKRENSFHNVCIGVSNKNFEEYNLILHKNYC